MSSLVEFGLAVSEELMKMWKVYDGQRTPSEDNSSPGLGFWPGELKKRWKNTSKISLKQIADPWERIPSTVEFLNFQNMNFILLIWFVAKPTVGTSLAMFMMRTSLQLIKKGEGQA